MKKHLLTLYLAFILSQSFCQSYELSGTVIDSTEGPLIAATIVLLESTDSTMVAFSLTNDKGFFELKNIEAGNYNLQITYIGYGTFQKPVICKGDEKKINLGQFKLSSANILGTVTVKGELTPIIVKKDTIEYNAAAFKVRPNATVEDLLKKLPGMEVDKEGNVKSDGEDINQVLVDGKKFFGNDPKMATKNIPADAVDKVQVYDKKSDKAEITGVDDGKEQKTLDLKLKEDKKNGMFGSVEGGYGTDDRYSARSNLFSFSKHTQTAVIAKYNNINSVGLSWNEYASLRTSGSGGRGSFSFNSNNAPISDQGNIGDAKSGTGGINFNYIKSKNTDLNLSYFISGTDKVLLQDTESENFNPRASYIGINSLNEETDNLRHNINGEYKTNIDSTKRLRITGNLGVVDLNSNTISNINNQTLEKINQSQNNKDESDETDNFQFSGGLSYTSRINNKGRSWALDASYQNNDEDYISNILQDLRFYDNIGILESTELINQNIDDNESSGYYNIDLTYTEPLSEQLYLSLELGLENNNSDRKREVYDILDNNDHVLRDDLSGLFNNDYKSRTLGLKLTKNGDAIRLDVGANYQHSELVGTQNNLDPIDRKFDFLLPYLSLDFDNIHSSINYNTSINEPSITQLQPLPNISNALSIINGNENLVPEYRHSLSLRYFNFDRFNYRSIWANLRASYTKDKIINQKTLGENLETIFKPINADYSANIAANLSLGTPINPLHLKSRFRVSYSQNFGFTFINEDLNKVSTATHTYTLTLENKNQKYISAELWGKLEFNNTNYRNTEIADNNYLIKKFGLDIAIEFGKGWYLTSDFESNIFSEEQFGSNNKLNYWNASFAKGFNDGRFELKISANDLLNQNTGIQRQISELAVSETRSNAIGRYYILTALYKLSSFTPQGMRIRKFR